MGRRYSPSHMTPNWNYERSSLGDTHVDKALGDLKKACAAEINALYSYEVSTMSTLAMLIDDDKMAKLKAVLGMITPVTDKKTYSIYSDVDLHIDFEGALVPPVEPKFSKVDPQRFAPLATFIQNIRPIHQKYEEVKAVLKWLNRHATPGAIRYYWPHAMKLCPNALSNWADYQEVPSRYSEPAHVADWLQPMRDAATTVVGSLLLPADATPKALDKMKLTFKAQKVKLSDQSEYLTDNMTYHL